MAIDERFPSGPYGGLTRDEYDDVMNGLYQWAESHPRRFEPIFFEMGMSYSAVDFVQAVSERRDIGMVFLEGIAYHSQRTNLPPRTFVDRAIVAERG